jgi:hypothetical protein
MVKSQRSSCKMRCMHVSHTHLCSNITWIRGHSWNQDFRSWNSRFYCDCEYPDEPEDCSISDPLSESEWPSESPAPFLPGLMRVTTTVIPSYSRWFVHVGSMRKHRLTKAVSVAMDPLRLHMHTNAWRCQTFWPCLTHQNHFETTEAAGGTNRHRSRLVRLHAKRPFIIAFVARITSFSKCFNLRRWGRKKNIMMYI